MHMQAELTLKIIATNPSRGSRPPTGHGICSMSSGRSSGCESVRVETTLHLKPRMSSRTCSDLLHLPNVVGLGVLEEDMGVQEVAVTAIKSHREPSLEQDRPPRYDIYLLRTSRRSSPFSFDASSK